MLYMLIIYSLWFLFLMLFDVGLEPPRSCLFAICCGTQILGLVYLPFAVGLESLVLFIYRLSWDSNSPVLFIYHGT